MTTYCLLFALKSKCKRVKSGEKVKTKKRDGPLPLLGILDQCPAVSYITASVAEMIGGMEVRRQQHYFSFARVMYHEWAAEYDVWLKPDDDRDGNSDTDNDDDIPGVVLCRQEEMMMNRRRVVLWRRKMTPEMRGG